MTKDWQRTAAIVLLAALGGGIIWWLVHAIDTADGLDEIDGGLLAAAFLSLREIFSKIEKIALGVRTPEPPTDPVGEE